MDLGQKIKKYIKEKNITNEEFALQLSISLDLLSLWIDNKILPSEEEMKKLSLFLSLEEDKSVKKEEKIIVLITSFLSSIVFIIFAFAPISYNEFTFYSGGDSVDGIPTGHANNVKIFYSIYETYPWLAYSGLALLVLSGILVCLYQVKLHNKKIKVLSFIASMSFLAIVIVTMVLSIFIHYPL